MRTTVNKGILREGDSVKKNEVARVVKMDWSVSLALRANQSKKSSSMKRKCSDSDADPVEYLNNRRKGERAVANKH